MGVARGLLALSLLAGIIAPGSALDEHGSDGGFAQEVNTAGSLFAFITNPVITSAPYEELTPEEILAVDSTFQIPESTPPSSSLINQTDQGTALPISDLPTNTPDSRTQLLVSGLPTPLLPPQNLTQGASLADRNRALVSENARLKQENEDLWQQFSSVMPRLTDAKTQETTQRVQAESTIQQLMSENEALAARNRDLRDIESQLQQNLTSVEEVLRSGRLEQIQRTIGQAIAQNETLTNQAIADQQSLEALRAGLASGNDQLDYSTQTAQQYLIDQNLRMLDSGLNMRSRTELSVTNRESNKESGTTLNRESTTVVGVVQVDVDMANSNDDNGDDLEASLDMVYVVALGFVFLLLQTMRVWLGHHLDTYMSAPLHMLFVDVSLMVALAVLTAIIDHWDWFDEDKIDLGKILYGFSLFILFWLLLGLWLVLTAQAIARKWFSWERECGDLLTLNQDYEQLYLRYTGQAEPKVEGNEFKQVRLTVQYAVMRQLFLCPLYLPLPTEQLLRGDFNLAEYLARCLADVLTKTFQLSFTGLITLLAAVGSWRLIVYGSFLVEMGFYLAVPLLLLLACVIIISKLRDIYLDLVPYVYDPAGFSLPASSGSSLASPGRVSQPNYLQGSLADLEYREDAQISCLCWEFRPLQLSCAYIFSGRLPNRHELLFWFDSYGPQFCQGAIQSVCIALTFWMMIILDYYVSNIYDKWDAEGLIAVVAAILLWVFTGCYLVPEAMRWLTLTSKIEQMKDREAIHAVVLKMKADRSLTMVKLYRQVKLVYREMNRDAGRGEMYALPDYMQEFVQEVFRLSCDPGQDILPLERVEDALDLCGVKLTLDELRVFMWESDAVSDMQDKHQGVTLAGFMKAVQVIFNSVTMRPEVVARKVLRRYSRDVLGNSNPGEMSLADLEQFFNAYGWHFTQEDIQDFMQAAKHLATDDLVNVDEVADFVRDSVDTFAK